VLLPLTHTHTHTLARNCSAGVIHADLSSLNVLLTVNWDPKVCDFNLSTAGQSLEPTGQGAERWMAPEMCRADGEAVTKKIDGNSRWVFHFSTFLLTRFFRWDTVYSFGVILCKRLIPPIPGACCFCCFCWLCVLLTPSDRFQRGTVSSRLHTVGRGTLSLCAKQAPARVMSDKLPTFLIKTFPDPGAPRDHTGEA
jgi:serine/threonine protein kinase